LITKLDELKDKLSTDICGDGTCEHQRILITSTEEIEAMF